MIPEAQTSGGFLQLSLGDTLAIVGLTASLVGNILQFQRSRSMKEPL
jgi:hypothetical protein